jgi:hypothetical protein
MSGAPAGRVREARQRPPEARRDRQIEGVIGEAAPAVGARWLAGASEPLSLLRCTAPPAGRGFRGAQAGYALHVQRTRGNREVARQLHGPVPGGAIQRQSGLATMERVQTTLTLGAPSNRDEHEAGWGADAGTRMPTPGAVPSIGVGQPLALQRARAAPGERVGRMPGALAPVPRAEGDDGGPAMAATDLEAGTTAVPGGGRPLPTAGRTSPQARMGADLSAGRVHAGPTATEPSHQLSPRAYAVGPAIVPGAGEYRPGTDEGRHPPAHGLTHVALPARPPCRRRWPAATRRSHRPPPGRGRSLARASARSAAGRGEGAVPAVARRSHRCSASPPRT